MYFNVQILRALAAILVVLHHSLPHYLEMGGKSSLLGHIGQYGFVGVDIFFVISGFVIYKATIEKVKWTRNNGQLV